MGLLGGEGRCEAKVGQMVADNEGVEVEGRRGVVLRQGLSTDFRSRETEGKKGVGGRGEAGGKKERIGPVMRLSAVALCNL